MLSPEVLVECFTQTLNPWRSLFVALRIAIQAPSQSLITRPKHIPSIEHKSPNAALPWAISLRVGGEPIVTPPVLARISASIDVDDRRWILLLSSDRVVKERVVFPAY